MERHHRKLAVSGHIIFAIKSREGEKKRGRERDTRKGRREGVGVRQRERGRKTGREKEGERRRERRGEREKEKEREKEREAPIFFLIQPRTPATGLVPPTLSMGLPCQVKPFCKQPHRNIQMCVSW